jgi:hypothetical protein
VNARIRRVIVVARLGGGERGFGQLGLLLDHARDIGRGIQRVG